MAKINSSYQSLKREYIFPIIEKKLEDLKKFKGELKIINLGIGDIALPLSPTVVKAVTLAVEEMGQKDSLKGYGPSEGYFFLREAIASNEFAQLGISPQEIFISEGTNQDIANIQEIFCNSSRVAVSDPTYPVYSDTTILSGKEKNIIYLPCDKSTGFVPKPPLQPCDLIYICSPNNPTGVALKRNELEDWVQYAKEHQAIILFDHAYLAFVTSPDVPKSIYEIPGAKEVVIEFRSFSKSAGFTGLRCAYTVVPKTLQGHFGEDKIPLHNLWSKRQSIKTNGVSYPIQKGAEAVYSQKGKEEIDQQIKLYQDLAKSLLLGLKNLGHKCYGGIDSPYIWWKTPGELTSWQFFDLLLEKCGIISVPGVGFGKCGEGYVRLSAFSSEDKIKEALNRIKTLNP